MTDELAARHEAAAIARSLADGDPAPMNALFADIGCPPPSLIWNPRPEDLELEPLRFLLDHWNQRRGARPMPAYREIDPLDLRPVLGSVSIVEVADGGTDPVYRVYGTSTAARMGVEMTGRSLWTAPVGLKMRIFHVAAYLAVHLRGEPLFTHHVTPTRRPVGESQRIILPLANGGARPTHLLVGIIPGDARPESIDDPQPH